MILGIGTDLVNIARIAQALDDFGERFIERCYAPDERSAAADNAPHYAKRWAAKEACAKAMGLGIRDGIYLKDIIIGNDTTGKPLLRLTGGAKAHLDTLVPSGMTPRISVSLTDEPPMALAFVVISAEKGA